MGRLIDADKLRYKHSSHTVNTTMPQSFPCITKEEINDAPTVEAISKADYENRLKADMVAMLEELDLQIDESAAYNLEVAKVQRLIRDKIDKLSNRKSMN